MEHFYPTCLQVRRAFEGLFQRTMEDANVETYTAAARMIEGYLGRPEARRLIAGTSNDVVQFCNWCPNPTNPALDHHPGGQAEHRE